MTPETGSSPSSNQNPDVARLGGIARDKIDKTNYIFWQHKEEALQEVGELVSSIDTTLKNLAQENEQLALDLEAITKGGGAVGDRIAQITAENQHLLFEDGFAQTPQRAFYLKRVKALNSLNSAQEDISQLLMEVAMQIASSTAMKAELEERDRTVEVLKSSTARRQENLTAVKEGRAAERLEELRGMLTDEISEEERNLLLEEITALESNDSEVATETLVEEAVLETEGEIEDFERFITEMGGLLATIELAYGEANYYAVILDAISTGNTEDARKFMVELKEKLAEESEASSSQLYQNEFREKRLRIVEDAITKAEEANEDHTIMQEETIDLLIQVNELEEQVASMQTLQNDLLEQQRQTRLAERVYDNAVRHDLPALAALVNGDREPAIRALEYSSSVAEDRPNYEQAQATARILQSALNDQDSATKLYDEMKADLVSQQNEIVALESDGVQLRAQLEALNGRGEITVQFIQSIFENNTNSDVTRVLIEAMFEAGIITAGDETEKNAILELISGMNAERTTAELETEEDVWALIQRELTQVTDATNALQAHVGEHSGHGTGGPEETQPGGGGGDEDGGALETEEPIPAADVSTATTQEEIAEQIADVQELLAEAENLPSEVEKRLEEVLANLEALAEKLVADNNPVTISIALSDIGNPVVTVSPAGSQVATDGTAQAVVPQAIPAQPIQAVPQPYAAVYTPVASPELAGMQAQINNIYATLQGLAANQAAQAAMANPALAQQAGLPQQLSGSCEQLLREMQQHNATTNQVLERMGRLIEETRSGATDETVRSQIDEALERNNAQIAQEIGTAIAGALNPIHEEISAMRTELNNALLARDAEWQRRMEEMETRYETQMAELREMLNQALESQRGNESDTLEGLNAELANAERELGRLRLAEFLLTDLNLDGIRGIEGLDLNEVTLAALAAAIEAHTSSLEGLVAEGADEQNREQNLIRVEQLRNLLRIIQEKETAGTPFQNPQELSDYLHNLSVEDYAAMLETRITALGDSTEPNVVFVRERLQLVFDNLNTAWNGMNEQARAEITTIRAFLDRRENNDETIDDVRRRITELNVRIADIRARIEALNNSAENTAPADNLAEAEPALIDAQANRAALEANLGALGAMLEAKPEKVKGWKKFLRAAAEVMTSMAGGLVMKAGIATLVGITVGATVLTGPMAIAVAGMTGAIGGAAFNGLFSAGLHYGLFHKEKHKIWAENHKKGNGVLYFFKNAIRKGTIEDYAIDDKLANLTAVFNKLGNADISSYTFADLEQFGISERDVLTAFRELLVLKELTNNVGLDGVELPNGVTFGSAGATVTATEAINRLATQIPAILNANGYDENRIASVQQLADEEVEKRYNDAFRSTILNKVLKGALIGGFTGAAISALEHFFNNPATEAAKDEAAKGVADRMARVGASKVPENIAEARQDFNIQQVAELRKAGMNQTQIDALFAQADLNKDGVISGSVELAKVSVVNTGGTVTGVVGASGDFLPGPTQLPSGWSSTLEARNLSDTWTLGPSGGDHGKLYIEVFNQVQDQVGSDTFAQGATFDKVVWPAIQDGIRNGYNVDSSYVTKLIEDAGLSSGAVVKGVVVASTGSSGDAALVAALGSIGTAFEQNIQALEVINNAAGNVVGVAEQVTSPANAGVAVPEFINNAAKQVVEVANNGWLMLAGALGAGVVSAALYSPDSENGVGGGAGNTGTGAQGGGNAGVTGTQDTAAQDSLNNPDSTNIQGQANPSGDGSVRAQGSGLVPELGIAPSNPESQTLSVDPATGRFVAPTLVWRDQSGGVGGNNNWLGFRTDIEKWANIAALPLGIRGNPFEGQARRDALNDMKSNNKYVIQNGKVFEAPLPLGTIRQKENQIAMNEQFKRIRSSSRSDLKVMIAEALQNEFADGSQQRLGKDDQWVFENFGNEKSRTRINDEMVDSFWSLMMVLNDKNNYTQDGKLRPDKADQFHGVVTLMLSRENQWMSGGWRALNSKVSKYRGIPALVTHAIVMSALRLSDYDMNAIDVQLAQRGGYLANIDQIARSAGTVGGGFGGAVKAVNQYKERRERLGYGFERTAPTAQNAQGMGNTNPTAPVNPAVPVSELTTQPLPAPAPTQGQGGGAPNPAAPIPAQPNAGPPIAEMVARVTANPGNPETEVPPVSTLSQRFITYPDSPVNTGPELATYITAHPTMPLEIYQARGTNNRAGVVEVVFENQDAAHNFIRDYNIGADRIRTSTDGVVTINVG